MRVSILSACCAALLAPALPALANGGWSSLQDPGLVAGAHDCPLARPSHQSAYRGPRVAGHHRPHAGGCPVVARGEPGLYPYERVYTPNGRDMSRPDQAFAWRRDRRAWADGDWSGRPAMPGAMGCRDANGPDAYRDGDGGHRAAPDGGMRCHDAGLWRDRGYAAQSRVQYGYSREMDSGWSSSEQQQGGWGERRRWAEASVSMTDRYGYLTWPGKTHFMHGQPIGYGPDFGPQAPPEESWQVHP
ncbi:MAG TPA: hypothetical protein VHZ26_10700 [Caulobacteraceae bacterium]|jgi:hypothetical protein|nr:hypothetical protein [Caulobacteraceae bacterium]